MISYGLLNALESFPERFSFFIDKGGVFYKEDDCIAQKLRELTNSENKLLNNYTIEIINWNLINDKITFNVKLTNITNSSQNTCEDKKRCIYQIDG